MRQSSDAIQRALADAITSKAACEFWKAKESAMESHFGQRGLQAAAALAGLNMAVFVAWASKRPSHQFFMRRNFLQHLPPSGTAAYTVLTSAFSPFKVGSHAIGLLHLAATSGFFLLAGCQAAEFMGPYNMLAFFFSAAAVSSLGGASLTYRSMLQMGTRPSYRKFSRAYEFQLSCFRGSERLHNIGHKLPAYHVHSWHSVQPDDGVQADDLLSWMHH